MVSFAGWAAFLAAALRLEGTVMSAENHLRLAVALAGAAVALFAVLKSGPWPRLLYLLAIGYLAYFAAGSAWRGLWDVAAIALAEGPAEILALALDLSAAIVRKDFAAGNAGLALAYAYDLFGMPLLQLVTAVYFARAVVNG